MTARIVDLGKWREDHPHQLGTNSLGSWMLCQSCMERFQLTFDL